MKNAYPAVLLACLAALTLLVAPLCLSKGLNHDELEHIHASWYVAGGYLPYLDFFQNHNPLAWYLYAPVILLFGETAASILIIRAVTMLIMAGSLAVVFLITRNLTSSWQTGVFAVLLLLTSGFYVKTGFEVRPDVSQVFFGLLSILFLLDFLKKPTRKAVFACGLCLAVSFLFLQKAVFLIGAVGLVFLYRFVRERMDFRFAVWFASGFLVPLGIFLVYLLINGMLEDYVITNWLVNMNRLRSYSPLKTIRVHLHSDYLFFIAAACSLPYLLLMRDQDRRVKGFAWISLMMAASILLYDRPHKQSFLQLLPLLGITSAVMVHSLFKRLAVAPIVKIILVLILLGVPAKSIVKVHKSSIEPRLDSIKYVLENTEPGDAVYDGNITFNVFRPDLHYFWYSLTPGKLLDSYNLVTGNRYGDYNIYDLILEKKPKFISHTAIGPKNPRFAQVAAMYTKSPYKNIYIRKPDKPSSREFADE